MNRNKKWKYSLQFLNIFLYCLGYSLLRLKIGLKVKYVTSNGKRYCYSEKGTAAKHESTMLFLHGFTSSKDAWNIIAEVGYNT